MSDYFRRYKRTLETKAMQQAMFYIAFQSVIFLFTFIPSNSSLCRNWWKPFSLSFVIAVLFGLHFISTTMKYIRSAYAQDINIIDRNENYHRMVSLEENVEEILGSQGRMAIVLGQEKKQQKPDKFAVYQQYACVGTTYSLLLAFTVLVLHACRSPACDAIT